MAIKHNYGYFARFSLLSAIKYLPTQIFLTIIIKHYEAQRCNREITHNSRGIAMNRSIERTILHKILLCLPVFMHPLHSSAASKGEAHSSHPIIEVPRQEVKDVPHALHRESDYEEKQKMFVNTLLPLLLMENELIETKRKRMMRNFAALAQGENLDQQEQNWLRDLAAEYKVDQDPITNNNARREMIERVDIIPVDLALAQAATETGWGASHGALKDRDLFGMTALRARRVKTSSGRFVRAPKFSSLREAVHTYIHNLNSHNAYKSLRAMRTKLRAEQKPIQGGAVADGLLKYSTRRGQYVQQIRSMIRQNNFNRYINARLLPGRDQVVSLDNRLAYAN